MVYGVLIQRVGKSIITLMLPNPPFLAQESQIHTYKQVQAMHVDLCQFIHVVTAVYTFVVLLRSILIQNLITIFEEYSIHAHFNDLSYQNIFLQRHLV